MSDKEALKNLKEDFYERFPDDWGKELWVKIEKDLEVLEILKKALIVELIDDFTTTQYRHAIEVRNHRLDEVFDEEDYLIVKKWLDGDDEE